MIIIIEITRKHIITTGFLPYMSPNLPKYRPPKTLANRLSDNVAYTTSIEFTGLSFGKYSFSTSVDNNGNRMRSAPAKNHNVDGRMIVFNLFRL